MIDISYKFVVYLNTHQTYEVITYISAASNDYGFSLHQ